MLLYISYDELSYIYEPHGTQGEVWDTTLEGSEMLKASGWKPFEMHRVSRHLHLVLISGDHLVRFVGAARERGEDTLAGREALHTPRFDEDCRTSSSVSAGEGSSAGWGRQG